ncbi:MAG: serine/threonine protein kinase [Psychroflexus sp.]|jgi:beta-lactam-binding protein with PASTA domain|nr:serine/threonine protein kinase [Psychroflexus sp.]MDR9447698.1 serine/threonine protein kinase [Psychroflexus sp.]
MKFLKFIVSKVFFKQLGLAVIITGLLLIGVFQWLKITTNHNEYIVVPNLEKLELDIVKKKLDNMNLRYELLDSANFNPNFKPLSIIEHTPDAGKKVKENRKIYLTLNPSDYRYIEIPRGLTGKTLRQVKPNLVALGFKIGEVTEEPNMAKDVVLKMTHKGEEMQAGDQIKKSSTIDLVVGDGSRKYLE